MPGGRGKQAAGHGRRRRVVEWKLWAGQVPEVCIGGNKSVALRVRFPEVGANRFRARVVLDCYTMALFIEQLEERRLMSASVELSAAEPPARRPRGVHNDEADIYGVDDRRIVSSTRSYPFAAVGSLEIEWSDGGVSSCSGALISPTHVLTAGHCVYDEEFDGYADFATFTPGQDGRFAPYGAADSKRMRVHPVYAKSQSYNHDYALITLDEPIGNETDFFGYASYAPTFYTSTRMVTAGYPGDRSGGTRMYVQSGKPKRVTAHEVLTKFDTGRGQSGSPLYVLDEGTYYVVGVLSSSGNDYSYFTRLTSPRLDTLDKWMNKDERLQRRADRVARSDRTPPAPVTEADEDRTAAAWRQERLSIRSEVLGAFADGNVIAAAV